MARISKKTSRLPSGASGFVHVSLLAYDKRNRPFLYSGYFYPRAEDVEGPSIEVKRWENGVLECIVPRDCQLLEKQALSGRIVDWVTIDGIQRRIPIVPIENRWTR